MKYNVLAPRGLNNKTLLNSPIFLPFDKNVIDFINTLSENILSNKDFREFPEMIALAFWIRRTNIEKQKKIFEKNRGNRLLFPRGIVFHIAPSNVDTIFVYSWLLSMLVGNINVVRLSSNISPQTNLLIGVINSILNKVRFEKIKEQVLLVQYSHDDQITREFSSNCDVRVIWGGDQTICKIRAIPLNPHSTEIIFSDKFSLAMIDANRFLNYPHKDDLIQNFYNDSFLFMQMACSSPRLVVWVGNNREINSAKEIFWKLLDEKVKKDHPEFYASNAIDKLVSTYALSIEQQIKVELSETNYINRIFIDNPKVLNIELHCGAGLFYEIHVKKLESIIPLITKKYQTISVFGINENKIKSFLVNNIPNGIDRIVPIGKALEFSHIWDGYDLFHEYTREVTIQI